MAKLILTTSYAGAGHLSKECIAQRVIALTHPLVWGAVPEVTDEVDFFIARREMAKLADEDWAYWDEWEETGGDVERSLLQPTAIIWSELVSISAHYSSIEFWIDPTPNAQLIMIQFLSWFGQHPNLVKKLTLVHADTPLGEGVPNGAAGMEPRYHVQIDQLKLATLGWTSFRRSTPEEWFRLLQIDLSVLPYFRQTVLAMLNELPDARTALSSTEAALLALIPANGTNPLNLFRAYMKNTYRVFDYWEIGLTLARLAGYPQPVVIGPDTRHFTLAMHDNKEQFARYNKCNIALSQLGKRLAAGQDDLSNHNSICRWWGGTRLSNQSLWRWDAHVERLVYPD